MYVQAQQLSEIFEGLYAELMQKLYPTNKADVMDIEPCPLIPSSPLSPSPLSPSPPSPSYNIVKGG